MVTFTGTDRLIKRLDDGWAATVEPDGSTPEWARGNYAYVVCILAFGVQLFF